MKLVSKLRSPDLGKMVRNPHFWIIISIAMGITFAYYNWYHQYEWFWYFSVWEFQNDIIGSLYFIPFLYASIVFWWRGILVVWPLSILAILPRMVVYSFGFEPLLRNLALASLPFTLVAVITLEWKWRERQKNSLAERERERQYYTNQILKAQEDERRRLAQELHDETIQELLVVANQAQSIVQSEESITSANANNQASCIRDSILSVTENLRRMSLDLRPGVLDDLGLVPAVRWLADNLYQENNIATKVMINGRARELIPETEVTIFRIVQEALSNIKYHSQATAAVITLTFADNSLKVVVEDNGRGFPMKEKVRDFIRKGRLGIIGMRQRAESLNGIFNISSKPDHGTLVSVEISE